MQEKRRVLVVDDEQEVAGYFEEALQAEGYEVHVAHEGAGAVAAARDISP